ncbi:vitellogenin-1-like [Gastrophryne carolinensis]
MQEFNGNWPADKFTSSSKLTKLLEKQLATPIKFEYSQGQVGELYIPKGLSETAANLLRGILNILQLTIKTTQNAYVIQENGISGICHTSYLIQENQKKHQLLITKSVNLNNCQEREKMVTGNAYFHTCTQCKQRNKNSRAAATYNYDVKATNMGGLLLGADVQEVHQFTPFNEIDGAVVVKARQRLVLAAVQELIHSTPENNDYITTESLRYHFEKKLIQTPIQLLRTKNTENQVRTLLQHLVEHNMGPLSKASPSKFLELVQYLRTASFEHIEGIWKQFSGRQHYRRWILDAIPAIGNRFSIHFLTLNLKELSEFEAAQALPLALHLVKADHSAIAEAKSLLEAVNSHGSSLLKKVAYLAYGSLVHKFCSVTDYCSEEALQPIHDLLDEATNKMNHEEIILALKAMGNAGQVSCIKRILKFLPRFPSPASRWPIPLQTAALLALKNTILRHPEKVMDICLQVYMDVQQHPILRMVAAAIILDNKPPSTIVMVLAKTLLNEADEKVGSFLYSLMKHLARSASPDFYELAAICSMAVTILKPKYEEKMSLINNAFYYDAYDESLKSGLQSIVNVLHNAGNVIPSAVFLKLKLHFMGAFTELFEINYRAEGLQELLMNRHFSGSGLHDIRKIMEMLKKLHDWKPLSSEDPLVSTNFKLFGQELFYQVWNKHSMENLLKFLTNGRSSLLQATVKELQNGLDLYWSKPLLSSENRLIVPTCVGLPLETSLYYSSVTRLQLQARSHITPDPKEDQSILQLLESNVNLKTKFALSMTKDIAFMTGINTDLIQAGMELRTQVSFVLPAAVDVVFNIGQKTFKMDFIPASEGNEVLSIRSKALAVTRNAEDLAAEKLTPVAVPGIEPNVLRQNFNPKDLSAGDTPRTGGKFSAEVLSKENTYWSEQPHRRPQWSDVSMCARAKGFGFQVCLVKNGFSAASVRSCPLYHMIGDQSLKIIFKPVHTGASVEKIQIEFQAGPGATMKMVHSVNVRRPDGRMQGMENPIDHVAFSKLQKILGTSEDNLHNSTSSSESSKDSDSSESSSESSRIRKSHEKHQEKKPHHAHHNNESTEIHHHKHQSGMTGEHHKHKPQQKSEELSHDKDYHHAGKHKTHAKKKEMEIHCKCWPESEDHQKGDEEHHHKHQHKTEIEDSLHEGHHGKLANTNHHKGSHEKWEKEQHHKRRHTQEHNHESQHGKLKHPKDQHHKDQHNQEHDHESQHGKLKHHKDQHHKDQHDQEHDHESQHGKLKHHKDQHHKDQHNQEHDHESQHGKLKHHKDQHYKDQHNQEDDHESQHGKLKHHKDHHHKDQLKEEHHHKSQHGKEEHHHQDQHHQDEHKKDVHHESQHGKSEHHHNDKHKSIRHSHEHKTHHKSVENDQYHKGKHEGEIGRHDHEHPKKSEELKELPRSHEGKRHCTCWKKQREDQNHHHNKKKHHHHHDGSKCNQTSEAQDEQNKCRFLSSESSGKEDAFSGNWSNYMELFVPEFVTTDFESTSTDMQDLSGKLSPHFVLLVKTVMSDAQHRGYQTTGYFDKSHVQVVTVSLDPKGSWKTCFDASVFGAHKASAVMRWGKNCQDYRITAQASTGQLAGSPAVQLAWQWKRLPSWIRSLAERAMIFVPGMGYALGFSEIQHRNAPHQLTVGMAATSADTFDIILKTPEMTIYKQGLPLALNLPHSTQWLKKIPLMEVPTLPEAISLMKCSDKAVCMVNTETVLTFDQMDLGCSLSPANCYTVIAQDCTNQLKFLVAMKKMGQGFSTFEMNVKLGSSDIKIHYDASEFHILLNGMWLLLKNDTYIDEKDCFKIHKNSTTVTVKAPKNGVEQISFNGQAAQIQISPLMHGKTCGLCGNADLSKKNDLKKPNHEMAKSCNGLVHSWTIPMSTCLAGCALTNQYVMLENQLIDQRPSTCFSVEPVLKCMKGCRPTTTAPVTVAFHCLPRDSAVSLTDWQANPRSRAEDLVKDVEAHTSCTCTEDCAAV